MNELLSIIWLPGAWLLNNQWILAIFLSLWLWSFFLNLIMSVVFEPFTKITGYLDSKITSLSERFGPEIFNGGSVWSPAMGTALLSLYSSGWLYFDITMGGIRSGILHIIFYIYILLVLVFVVYEIGKSAYKTIKSLPKSGSSIYYPYRLQIIIIGIFSGILGKALSIGSLSVIDFGVLWFENMEVLVGCTIILVGWVIRVIGLPFYIFSLSVLSVPIIHALICFMVSPFFLFVKKHE